jgi:hypothetical protein
MILIFQNNYRCRLFKFYVVNIYSFGSVLCRMIVSYSNRDFQNKVCILDKKDELFETINFNKLENKYGGICKNKDKDFFPPHLVSNNYIVEGKFSDNNQTTDVNNMQSDVNNEGKYNHQEINSFFEDNVKYEKISNNCECSSSDKCITY